ncbi:PEP-CTERM sorting domain-containing protein [Myxococcota bacterium]|nr:PEP-CTERM sorting domain-containing protein [Myxococcota bacterium]
MRVAAFLTFALMIASQAGAVQILLASGDASLSGLNYSKDDVVSFDTETETASVYFTGADHFAASNEDIDALQLLDNGNLLLSTKGDASLGGISFDKADVVEYDPVAESASIIFSGDSVFTSASENIDALHLRSNGNLIFSTAADAKIGSLSITKKDLVEYDPVAETATILFDGTLTSGSNRDINAFQLLADGTYVLSTAGNASLGGASWSKDDLVQYDPVSGSAHVFFEGANYFASAGENVEAAFVVGGALEEKGPVVPEPSTGALVALGIALLSRVERRHDA